MQVELLYNSGMEVIEEACMLPYRSPRVKGLAKRVWDSGHRSVARHSIVVFRVEGISQSLLRQLSRHPHINLTVESTRYCDMEGVEVYIPDEVKRAGFEEQYLADMEAVGTLYTKWQEFESLEDVEDISKLFLPLGSTTKLIMSGNYQAMYEFLQLRLCIRAEKEIRKMAIQIRNIMKKEVPDLFEGIDCIAGDTGICLEAQSCGKYPKKGVR